MSITNLWLWSNLQSPEATSVFLFSHLVWDAREEARKEVERITWEINLPRSYRKDVKDFILTDWHFPRNIDFLKRRKDVWSFILSPYNSMWELERFISQKLLLELWSSVRCSSINWWVWLILELQKWSKITLSQLWDAVTDFISWFIKTLKIDIEELETLERDDWDYKDILPKLPNDFDEEEKEKLLFSISQSVVWNTIYFTDLTPIHPNFLHELLLFLDERFQAN